MLETEQGTQHVACCMPVAAKAAVLSRYTAGGSALGTSPDMPQAPCRTPRSRSCTPSGGTRCSCASTQGPHAAAQSAAAGGATTTSWTAPTGPCQAGFRCGSGWEGLWVGPKLYHLKSVDAGRTAEGVGARPGTASPDQSTAGRHHTTIRLEDQQDVPACPTAGSLWMCLGRQLLSSWARTWMSGWGTGR